MVPPIDVTDINSVEDAKQLSKLEKLFRKKQNLLLKL